MPGGNGLAHGAALATAELCDTAAAHSCTDDFFAAPRVQEDAAFVSAACPTTRGHLAARRLGSEFSSIYGSELARV